MQYHSTGRSTDTSTEYNEIQCDKRNSYRHRVKEEKAKPSGDEITAPSDAVVVGAESTATAVQGDISMNGAAQDHETGPPSKKLKGTGGEVVATPGEQVDDEDVDEVEPDVEDAEDEGDDGEDGEQDGEDEIEDEPMVDVESEEEEEAVGANGPDEALDDGDDSD